jgi:hypothetical protein
MSEHPNGDAPPALAWPPDYAEIARLLLVEAADYDRATNAELAALAVAHALLALVDAASAPLADSREPVRRSAIRAWAGAPAASP